MRTDSGNGAQVGSQATYGDPSSRRPKDIALVLVTGAGASREFGANGQKLPLMAEWSDLVLRKLVESAAEFREITGLRPGMSGPEFEQALGQFLRQAEAFAAIKGTVPITAQWPQAAASISKAQLEQWYASSEGNFERITNAVVASLVEQFNDTRVSPIVAAQAYRDLFTQLELTVDQPFVLATTNYDPVAELALYEIGRRPDCGEPPYMFGVQQRPLDVVGMLDGLPRHTPILHLHGKVGWYRDPMDGLVRPRRTATHEATYGVPVVMLPDPEKEYGDEVLTTLWSQFEDSLRRAERVLVLGHSLSDPLLVKALHDRVHQQRLAIAVLSDGKGNVDGIAMPFLEWLRTEFPQAKYVPYLFGGETAPNHVLQAWVGETRNIGLAVP
jgi:hypothetical protein